MKKIKTFYFICTGIGVLGFALVAVPVQLGLLLDDSYGYGAYTRGWMLSLTSIASLIAIPIAGLAYDRLFRKNPSSSCGSPARSSSAYGLLLFIAMRFQPIVPLLIFVALGGACTSAAFVSVGPIVGAVAPYRMRTQAFALIPVFIFLMGGFFGGILAGALSDAHGERTALSIVAPIAGTIGGLLFVYGSRYLKRDISLAVEELLEEQAELGRMSAEPRRHSRAPGAQPRLQLRTGAGAVRRRPRGAPRRGARAARHERRGQVDAAARDQRPRASPIAASCA